MHAGDSRHSRHGKWRHHTAASLLTSSPYVSTRVDRGSVLRRPVSLYDSMYDLCYMEVIVAASIV